MRTLPRAGAFAVAATSAAILIAPTAHATPYAAPAAGPGDNGTVKIHDALTSEEFRRNEPHVCTFYLDAFGFDGGQRVDWRIEAWAPTATVKGESVRSGSLTLDAGGHGRTEDLRLPDGHYKLFWTFDGEHGSARHKVFWTDCEEEGRGNGQGEPAVDPAASTSASLAATGDRADDATDDSGEAPSAQAGDSGDLAATGSGAPGGALSAVAAALLAAGGWLLLRRRKAHQGRA